MKKSTLSIIVVTLFFIVLVIFGIYINVINRTPDYKTFLFVCTLGVLGFISHGLIQSMITDKVIPSKRKNHLIRKVRKDI